MKKENTTIGLMGREAFSDALTDLLRDGAQRLIQQAVEAELQTFMEQFSNKKLEDGRAAVVRNGHLPAREIQTGIGAVRVQIPKVRSKDGEPVSFQSALVPPYVRKSASLEAAIPWLYLKGISGGEMSSALETLVGAQAKGLSASTVSRLKQTWGNEYKTWRQQRLDNEQWVYLWADGIYSGLRTAETKLCALVIIGVNERGEKHFLAIEDGVRESTQSWREILLNLKARGMNTAKLAVGDGAMGFWTALDEIYPDTLHQRCWVHKMNNVLNCLPKTLQPKAKQAMHEIWQAPTRDDAEQALANFIKAYEDKYPKATIKLVQDQQELLAFYDFPVLHWQSLRTTNPIESAFATIRHRTKRSKGCLSLDGMLHMMFKLAQCAEQNWRKLRGFKCLIKVIEGVKFKDGIEVITNNQVAA